VVQGRRIGTSDNLGSLVDEISDPVENSIFPQVASDSTGKATVLWISAKTLVVRDVAADEAMGARSAISVPSDEPGPPVLAGNPSGALIVLWQGIPSHLRYAFRPAGSSFGPARDLVTPIATGFYSAGIDSEGNAAGAWNFAPGAVSQIAGFDAAGPRLSGVQIPTSGQVGTSLGFSLGSAFDVWSPIASTDWDFGDGGRASGSSVNHTYNAAGNYRPSVSVTDAVGNASSASGSLSVAGADDVIVERFSVTRKAFSVGPRATAKNARKKRRAKRKGTTFLYRLSRAATATITIERVVTGRRVRTKSGRKVKTKCKKLTRKNRARRRCKLYRRVGTLTRAAKQGNNRTAFSGRIGKRKLRPGRYRARITAKTPQGKTSKARTATFRVVRRR
jgi:hypothetical protein